MTAAYRLCQEHEVTVFESADYVGGHTNTVDVEHAGKTYAVDTGFIVFNDWTYPRFIELLAELGVAWQPSDMSFSVRCEKTGLEYNGTSMNSLFAQRRNLLRPSFLRMVSDIVRFNRRAPALLQDDAEAISLGSYLAREGYSTYFIDHYIIPMGAAIWSSRPRDMLNFPMRFFVEFFANHGFLSVNERPTWQVIQGGSREYVKKLTAPYAHRIRLNTPVAAIQRQPHQVLVRTRSGDTDAFDQIFIACHSDQALRLLSDPSVQESEILGSIAYQANEALLHTDDRMMPRRNLAHAAWNYHLPIEQYERVTVTYNMNILQSLQAPVQFLLTLNRSDDVDEKKVLRRFVYHHPVYTSGAVAAQKRHAQISGIRRTFYCGAYWSYGFHEDGVRSALRALQQFKQQSSYEKPHLQRVG
jgi:predicted NAD/FAD-binding protein